MAEPLLLACEELETSVADPLMLDLTIRFEASMAEPLMLVGLTEMSRTSMAEPLMLVGLFKLFVMSETSMAEPLMLVGLAELSGTSMAEPLMLEGKCALVGLLVLLVSGAKQYLCVNVVFGSVVVVLSFFLGVLLANIKCGLFC